MRRQRSLLFFYVQRVSRCLMYQSWACRGLSMFVISDKNLLNVVYCQLRENGLQGFPLPPRCMGRTYSTPLGLLSYWALHYADGFGSFNSTGSSRYLCLGLGENSSTPHIEFCDCEWGCITLITNTIFIIQITICHMPNVIKKICEKLYTLY